MDMGLYRMNGRGEIGCRRNNFFLSEKISKLVFLLLHLYSVLDDGYIWLFLKKESSKRKQKLKPEQYV